jgi:hypothetical protein
MAAVLGLALILSVNLAGAAGGQRRAEFEVTALRGTGTGELGRRIDRAGWGGSLFVGRPLPGTPFSLGVRLALVNYGSERNTNLAGYTAAAPAGVTYKYNILFAHIVFRAQSRTALFTPYLEALAGIHYFFTQAYSGRNGGVPFMVGDAVLIMNQNGSTTVLSSVTPSAGLGGGLMLRLARISPGREGTGGRWGLFLDLQGRYLIGGRANYLTPGGLDLDGDRLVCDVQRSRTDMLCFSLGFSLRRSP